jgi:hypothetical protein
MKLAPFAPSFALLPLAAALSGACGGVVLVPATQQTALLDQTYAPAAVRDAVVRSMTHKRLSPQGEADGLVTAADLKRGCVLRIQYAATQVVVAPVPPAATPTPAPTATPADPSAAAARVDRHCEQLATQFARAVADEVQAPAREAAKEVRDQRNAEVAVARAQAFGQAAAAAGQTALLAREQLAQQQGGDGQPAAADDDGGGDQGEAAAPDQGGQGALAGQPAGGTTVVYNNVTSNTNVTNNVRVNRHRAATGGGAQPQGPAMKPNVCCRGGEAYVCPSPQAYAAACIQKPAAVSKICRADATQRAFCPH